MQLFALRKRVVIGGSPPECGYPHAFSRICRSIIVRKMACIPIFIGVLHCQPFGNLYLHLLLSLIISLAPGSLDLERFWRSSTSRWIHFANQMIHWTTWNHSLPYVTQVIRALTQIFLQAFLLPINQSSIRLVTSIVNYTIFTNILNTENLEI